MVVTSLDLLNKWADSPLVYLTPTEYWAYMYKKNIPNMAGFAVFIRELMKSESLEPHPLIPELISGIEVGNALEILQFIANQYEFYLRAEIPLEQYKFYCVSAAIRLYLNSWRLEFSKNGIAAYLDMSPLYKSDISYIYKDIPKEIIEFHQTVNTEILTEEDLKNFRVAYHDLVYSSKDDINLPTVTVDFDGDFNYDDDEE